MRRKGGWHMYYNQTLSPSPMMTTPFFHNNQHIIEVSGEGTVSIAPDKAIIVLGAITENISLNVAQKENANTVSNIINSLLELSIPKENIQTVNYSIDIQYNYEDGKQTLRGYKVTHLLQVTIDKIDQTGLIVDTAVYNGANSVSNIQFTVAHPEVYYNQALSLAIKNGQQKAIIMAKTLGVTLNRIPNQVQEVSRTLEPSPYQTSLYAKSAVTPIQPGELEISATIKAKYSYV
jgi:uncharacterized protein YggE